MMRSTVAAVMLSLSLGLALAPASAVTKQSAPRNSDGSSRLVDPDEQAEKLSDRTRRNNDRAYRQDVRDNRNLIRPSGPAAASFGGVYPR